LIFKVMTSLLRGIQMFTAVDSEIPFVNIIGINLFTSFEG